MQASPDSYTYVGRELDLFASATHWKQYLFEQIRPFLGSDVLEVGAGIGATTHALCRGVHRRWVCLEPDEAHVRAIATLVSAGGLPPCCQAQAGTLRSASGQFDSILYIDVLEHIEDDQAELASAADHLAARGHLVVLAPAHPWLYSKFDAAVGHYRRYTPKRLASIAPPHCDFVQLRYLDAVGVLASVVNRLVLSQSLPTRSQIALWDKRMVPLSRWVDRCTLHALGRSVLAVWRAR